MAKEKLQTKEDSLAPPDDFKLIHGIGPGIESRLIKAGIHTYDRLASLNPEEIVSSLGTMIGVTPERVVSQDWIGQARELAARGEQSNMEAEEPADASGRKHYATFTVELLMDGENQVRRTRTTHIQSETEESWAGWEQGQLIRFINDRAGLHFPIPQGGSIEESPVTPEPASRHVQLSGETKLVEFICITNGKTDPRRVVENNKSFGVRIALDLKDITRPKDMPLSYHLELRSRNLKNGSRQKIGYTEGTVPDADLIQIELKDLHLSEGIYRLEAAIVINTSVAESKKLSAFIDGCLLHIY